MESINEPNSQIMIEPIQVSRIDEINIGRSYSVCDDLPDRQYVNTGTEFYTEAKKYWSSVPATVDGMLGGFGSISYRDIKGSSAFLKDLFKMKPAVGRHLAVDCGAGIGRVTKFLLFPVFRTVDMVEQSENFVVSARGFLGRDCNQLGTIYNLGLQNFNPEAGKYDLVWCQWVLSHLTDEDLKKFLERAALALAKNGVIVIKENVTSSGHAEVDTTDSSVTRPLKRFHDIISAANLRIIKSVKQTDLPKGLYPIYMMALRPIKKSQ